MAVNLTINGSGVCLPTSFGYAAIVVGSWLLRDRPPFRLAAVLATLLAIITFPDLFRHTTDGAMESFDRWMFTPSLLLEAFLISVVAFGIRKIADRRGKELLKRLATTTIAVLVLSLLGWWFIPVTSNATLVASFVVYEIPAIFLAAVCALAAKQLA